MSANPGSIGGYSWQESGRLLPRVNTAMHGTSIPCRFNGRFAFPCWVLDYSCSHCGLVRVGTARSPWLERPPGVAHLYPPHTTYWQDQRSCTRMIESAFVIFEGGYEAGLAEVIPEGRCFARIRDTQGLLLPQLKAAASAGVEHGAAGFWAAQAALCTVIHLLRRVVPETAGTDLAIGPDPVGSSSSFVTEVDAILSGHVGGQISLAKVARVMCISPSTLSHKYAAEAGRPPLATFNRMRLESARALIMSGLKLDAVAAQTGFCDAYHLSKAFHRHFSLPPAAYRRTLNTSRSK